MKQEESGEHKLLHKVLEQGISEGPSKIQRVQGESSEIQKIKNAIPSIKNLHPSWNCAEHVGWQILRLNQAYRESVKKYYEEKFKAEYLIFGDKDPCCYMPHPFFLDYPPLPQEPFQDYEERVTAWVENNIRHQSGLFRGVKINKNDPIPYSIRPCPLIRPLLPIHDLNLLTTGKGRAPTSWSINLLVYELAMAGMKNAEIGRLLFGMKESRPSRADPKHPILVKIAKIKKSMGKIVLRSFR